jgi:hypothetical protein
MMSRRSLSLSLFLSSAAGERKIAQQNYGKERWQTIFHLAIDEAVVKNGQTRREMVRTSLKQFESINCCLREPPSSSLHCFYLFTYAFYAWLNLVHEQNRTEHPVNYSRERELSAPFEMNFELS